MINLSITIQPVNINKLTNLIEFDDIFFQNALKEAGVPIGQLPPQLTIKELQEALDRKDTLQWIFANDKLAGYFWFEIRSDCLYVAGVAIKPDFYGKGLAQYILNLADKKAKEHHLTLCKLAVIPLNGRAVNFYFKNGYQVTQCVTAFFGEKHPETFRFIMGKNLIENQKEKTSIDEVEIDNNDNEKLKSATDNGYIGVQLNGNKIRFIRPTA